MIRGRQPTRSFTNTETNSDSRQSQHSVRQVCFTGVCPPLHCETFHPLPGYQANTKSLNVISVIWRCLTVSHSQSFPERVEFRVWTFVLLFNTWREHVQWKTRSYVVLWGTSEGWTWCVFLELQLQQLQQPILLMIHSSFQAEITCSSFWNVNVLFLFVKRVLDW